MFDYAIGDPYLEAVIAGGVKAAFFDTNLGPDLGPGLRALEGHLRRIDDDPRLVLATSSAEIKAAQRAGQMALVIGCQSPAIIGHDISRLRMLHRLGFRWIQLTYSYAELFGDGCAEPRDGGLTYLGREFIECVNELGMLLDLSHCGTRTTAEAIEIARAPVITHANAYAVNPNPRNKSDEVVRTVVAKGGMVGICGLPAAVKPRHPTLDDWLDHCDHFVKLVGAERVGIGADFMTMYKGAGIVPDATRRNRTLRPDIFGSVEDFLRETYPTGVETVKELPNFTQGLFDRGYSEDQVAGIIGGNWLRIFEALVG